MAARDLLLPLPQPAGGADVLGEFIRNSRPWSAERVLVPTRVRRALWLLLPVDLLWGIGLLTIAGAPCDGRLCEVATLGNRPAILLVFTAVSVVALGLLALTTRSFSKANHIEVAEMIIAVAAAIVALLGIAALLFSVAIVLFVGFAFLGALTITP